MKTLADLYQTHTGKVSDKWALYLREYDRLFSPYRDQAISLLEIGVQNGGSLEIWSQYFPNAQKFVGCDINPDCAKLTYADPRISVIVGDATTTQTQAQILQQSASFDLIIEDGSHTSSDIVKAFAKYFPALRDGGLFVAEDLHCSYWQAYEGGIYYPCSSINFFKRLADVLNHEHWGLAEKRSQLLSSFSEKFGLDFSEEVLHQISSIEFLNSICIVKKYKKADESGLGERIVAGCDSSVMPVIATLAHTSSICISQIENQWTTPFRESEFTMLDLKKEIEIKNVEIENKNSDFKDLSAELDVARIKNQSQDKLIQMMKNSRSWRYTKIFRSIESRIRYLKNTILNRMGFISQKGGLKEVILKIIKLIKKEGMTGFLDRTIHSPKLISEEKFDSAWYLEFNKDVAQAGIDPYLHYSTHGFAEGRFARALGEKVLRIDSPSPEKNAQLIKLQNTWTRQPKISILMPVYNTKEAWLRDSIDSVLSQIYENWELCVCDDASTLPHVKAVLVHYENIDPRIRVVYAKVNAGVSAASNLALQMADGDYVALMDHDDILEPHAAHYVAKAIIEKRPDIIYSDEVLMDEDCQKTIGHACRPSFSLELLRSHPYIVHLVAYRRALLQKIGGFNEALSISQDYDLLLRACEASKNIVHVAEVLYKWRTHENSAGHEKKKYVMDVSRDVIRQHLQRSGYQDFQIEDGDVFNFFKIRYKIDPASKVAIIIPTKNMGDLVRQCIESIEKTTASHFYDIVLIDHASTDPESIEYFTQLSQKHRVLKCDGEFNFSRINNWAIHQLPSTYSHYLLLNNDVEAIHTGWLERMLELGQQADIGIVGAKLYYPDGQTIQHAGVCVGMYGVAEHYGKFMDKNIIGTDDVQPGYLGSLIANREMSAVTAACMLIRSDVFHQAHGLDEHAKIGFGDVDFCLRVLTAGYRVIFCADAELIHHESLSRGKSETDPHPEDTAYFLQRWSSFIQNGDPFYNPNLSLSNTHWGLKLKFDAERKNTLNIRDNLNINSI